MHIIKSVSQYHEYGYMQCYIFIKPFVLRRWTNINSKLDQRLVFPGILIVTLIPEVAHGGLHGTFCFKLSKAHRE